MAQSAIGGHWRRRSGATAVSRAFQTARWRFQAWREPALIGPASVLSSSALLPSLPIDARSRAAVAGVALAISVLSTAALYPSFAAPWVAPHYELLLNEARGIAVHDRAGAFAGTIPAAMLHGPRTPTGHKALAPDEAPELWWQMVVLLEDRHLGTWRSVHGIDLGGLVKAAWTPQQRGGSSLVMQLVRNLNRWTPDPYEPFWKKVPRKLRELRDAPVLYRQLGGYQSEAFKEAVAMHVPLVDGMRSGTIGGSVYGIAHASEVLFNRPASQTTDAQSAILAAAMKRPILVRGDPEKRVEYWAATIERAEYGLALALEAEPERRAMALSELRAYAASLPEARLPTSLASAFVDRPLSVGLVAAANPVQRANRLAYGEIISASGELLEAFGPSWANEIAELSLTLDLGRNASFKVRVEEALAEAQSELAGTLLRPLLSGAAHRPDILLVAVDETGQVLAHYNNTARPILHGYASRRDADGRYDPARETMQIASVGKVLAALLLAQNDPLDAAYCNRYLKGIRNWDGDTGVRDCGLPGAMIPMERAFGRSINLPVIEGLKSVSPAEAELLVTAAGFRMPDDVAPRVAIPLGMVTGSPAAMLQLMLATGLGVDGRPAVAPAVRLLQEAERRDGGLLHPDGRAVDLSPWLESDRARQWIRQALSAPLSGEGTLAILGPMLAGTGIEGHLAKTGTVAMNRQTVARYLVGTFRHDGRRFAWLVHVGGEFARPLGQSIDNRALAPLADALVRQAIAASQQAGG